MGRGRSMNAAEIATACLMHRVSPNGRRYELFVRILKNVLVSPANGCWVWQGGDSGSGRGGGYGRVSVDGQMMAVHRVIYMLIFGPIHANRQVDHACVNRLCCNPDHLEGVTHKQNQRRRVAA